MVILLHLVQKTRIQAANYIFYFYSRFTYLTHVKFDHKEKYFVLIDINLTTFAKRFWYWNNYAGTWFFLIYHDIKIIQAIDVWRLIESAKDAVPQHKTRQTRENQLTELHRKCKVHNGAHVFHGRLHYNVRRALAATQRLLWRVWQTIFAFG